MSDSTVNDAAGGDAGPETPGAAAPAGASALRLLWLSAALIGLDQATKWLITTRFELFERQALLPILEITRLHNRGAAFSFLNNASGWQHYFFVALACGVSAGIVYWLGRLRLPASRLLASGLALILGGALGNVIDRLVHGYVVDFIHVHWFDSWYFPAFNVADSGITIGAGLLVLDALLDARRGTPAARP